MSVKLQTYSLELNAQAVRMAVEDGLGNALKYPQADIVRRFSVTQRIKKKFVCTTDSNHSLPVAKNLVAQKFKEKQPNRVWLSDITYIPTKEGWLYLAGLKDVCTKEIVGFSMTDTMHKELVIKALMNAFRYHRPSPGIVVHSDRGSQYCSHEYKDTFKHT